MKAVVLKEAKKLVMEEVPDPIAGKNEVVVKVRAVSICGSDMHIYNLAPFGPDLIMGHELAGTIVELGIGAEGWKNGDDVWVSGGGGCCECPDCLRGNHHVCKRPKIIATGDVQGGYAEYIKVPKTFLYPLPNGVSFRAAAQVDTLGIGFRAVELAGVGLGTSVVVLGGGAIGLYAVQCAKAAGAGLIILSEPTQLRADLGRKLGANITLDPTKEKKKKKILELTDGEGVDVVLECAGRKETVESSINLVPRGTGKVVWMGVCLEEITFVPWLWVEKDITVHWLNGIGRGQVPDKCLQLLEQKKINTDSMISSVIALEELPEAFERLTKPNKEIKIVVEFE